MLLLWYGVGAGTAPVADEPYHRGLLAGSRTASGIQRQGISYFVRKPQGSPRRQVQGRTR